MTSGREGAVNAGAVFLVGSSGRAAIRSSAFFAAANSNKLSLGLSADDSVTSCGARNSTGDGVAAEAVCTDGASVDVVDCPAAAIAGLISTSGDCGDVS